MVERLVLIPKSINYENPLISSMRATEAIAIILSNTDPTDLDC